MDRDNISLKEDASAYNITVKDDLVPASVVFLKGEEPRGNIEIKDKDGNLLIKDDFPEVKKR